MTNVHSTKGTILAVDDTPASLRLLSDLLKAEGYEVRSAINGELALRSAFSNPPELVLLDIQMPEMDGYEVCRRLRAESNTRDVPILFLSSFSETEEKLKGFALGAVDYLTKPYQREELLARVSTHLELHRMRFQVEAVLDERTRELAEALEALQDSDQRYRIAFKTSLDTICFFRLDDGVIIDVNDTFFDVLGYTRDELVNQTVAEPNIWFDLDGERHESTFLDLAGRTIFDLNLWVEAADQSKWLEVLRRDSICRNFETHLRRKDGQIFWALISASMVEIEAVPCALMVIRDVSETKAAAERLAATAEALRSSEERYRTAFQTSLDIISISMIDSGEFIEVNHAFTDVLGYERQEVIGHTALEFNIWTPPEERRRLKEILQQHSTCRNFETQFRKKCGQLIWVQISASSFMLDGTPCMLMVVHDITEGKAAAEALLASEARYRTVFRTALDPISISRLDNGVFIDTNQAFLDLYGYQCEEIIGHEVLQLGLWEDPRDRESVLEKLRQQGSCRDFETRFRKKNGERVYGLFSASIIEIKGVPCILTVNRDISAAKAAEEKIQNLSFYDTLTSLPNRRLMMECLKKSLAASLQSQHKKALLFIDLDHFKTMNDTLGHPVGDLLLQEVARRIRSCVHESDTVARIGGDEFLVILEVLSETAEEAATQAGGVGERILARIAEDYSLAQIGCRCSASIGITVFGEQSLSTDEVLKQADIAMGHAKAAGRNTTRFFSQSLQAAVNARTALEDDLRLALVKEQFQLYYQPQVDGTRMTGAEALVRWVHPTRGIVSPGAFIPLAEETGLILPMGDWVLDAACRQIAIWAGKKQFAGLSIAVNISAIQFHQPDFVEKVLGTLDRTGANPESLELELTESILIENVEDVVDKMTALKARGIRFSLDDFGIGYSSLAYLKRLPLNKLKIDISFVRDILEDASSGVIAQTVVALGRAMGLYVIAEGVETEAQREFLAGLGCTAYQGYLFSRPLPREVFEQMLCN